MIIKEFRLPSAKRQTCFCVTVVLREFDCGLLPETDCRRETSDRIYRLYKYEGALQEDEEFCDVDGDLLTAVRHFRTQVEAEAWVNRDVAQRAALRRLSTTGQPS